MSCPWVLKLRKLARPLTSYNTQESRPGTLHGQRTRTDPVILGAGEPALRASEQSSWTSPFSPFPVCLRSWTLSGQNSRTAPECCECGWARCQDLRVGELARLIAAGCSGWAKGGCTRALMRRESWQVDQPNNHPSPEEGLWVGLLQPPLDLWTTGECKEDEPTDPKHQNLHDTGEQQNIQENPSHSSSR